MEQQIPAALERIENPILIILLVVLIIGGVSLWFAYRALQTRLMDALLKNIEAMTNINAALSNIKERLDELENAVTSRKK